MDRQEHAAAVQEHILETNAYMSIANYSTLAESPTLKIALIDAREAPAVAATFLERKQACYARFGAASASVAASMSAPRNEDEELHLVIAFEPDTGAMVGGLALYGRGPSSLLPMEKAIGSMESFRHEIASWQARKLVEFGGFWMEDIWRKTGLSEQIVLTAIAACQSMGTDKIVALAHHHVIESYRAMGVIPDPSLARFAYPTAEYITAMIWADPVALSTVPAEKRDLVNAHARRLENGGVIHWFCDDESLRAS